MTIGNELKKIRIMNGWTQADMVKDTDVPLSTYARAEKSQSNLSALNLFKIVQARNLNINEIYSEVVNEKNSLNILKESDVFFLLKDAFFKNDLSTAKKINSLIKKSNFSKKTKIRATLIVSVLSNSVNELKTDIKNAIVQQLFLDENWTQDLVSIKLFCDSMLIFNEDELNRLIRKLIKRYSNTTIFSEELQNAVGGSCLNYIHICYLNKNKYKAMKAMNLIENFPITPTSAIQRIMVNYYKALFQNDKNKMIKIRKFMKKMGIDKYILHLPL